MITITEFHRFVGDNQWIFTPNWASLVFFDILLDFLINSHQNGPIHICKKKVLQSIRVKNVAYENSSLYFENDNNNSFSGILTLIIMNSIKITTFYVTLMDTLQTYNAREITIYSLDPYENLKNSKKSLVELYGTILWGNKSQLTKRVPKKITRDGIGDAGF